MSMATMVTATDDDVFRAFVLGDALEGDTAQSSLVDCVRCHGMGIVPWPDPGNPELCPRCDGDGARSSALYSHGVLLALRSEECVVFDARPCHDGGRCTCRYMADAARARKAAGVHYATDEVCSLDHGAFVDLARRLGAVL